REGCPHRSVRQHVVEAARADGARAGKGRELDAGSSVLEALRLCFRDLTVSLHEKRSIPRNTAVDRLCGPIARLHAGRPGLQDPVEPRLSCREPQVSAPPFRISRLRRNIVCVGSPAHEYTVRLESALERRGNPLSVDALLDILREASESTSEALSEGERAFLLESTDLPEADLTPQARAASLTTAEVAELLGRKDASIRRSKAAGDLYALPSSGGRTARFPAWQFEGSQIVPGLREIVPAFPGYFHPLSIQGFMTTPHDELGARSPAQWLLRGGPAGAVVALVEELGYE